MRNCNQQTVDQTLTPALLLSDQSKQC